MRAQRASGRVSTANRERMSKVHEGSGSRVPLLLVRAGNDQIPTLLDSVDRFIAAALAADYPLTVVNKPGGAHGFDNSEPDERSREIIRQTLAFYGEHLKAGGSDDGDEVSDGGEEGGVFVTR